MKDYGTIQMIAWGMVEDVNDEMLHREKALEAREREVTKREHDVKLRQRVVDVTLKVTPKRKWWRW